MTGMGVWIGGTRRNHGVVALRIGREVRTRIQLRSTALQSSLGMSPSGAGNEAFTSLFGDTWRGISTPGYTRCHRFLFHTMTHLLMTTHRSEELGKSGSFGTYMANSWCADVPPSVRTGFEQGPRSLASSISGPHMGLRGSSFRRGGGGAKKKFVGV